MRITQRTMYNGFVEHMNKNLSAYAESNLQSATQKQINRPSDDPVGMARVLNYRAAIARNEQYISNAQDVHTALSSAETALTQVQTILSQIRVKAEQAATGTVTPENRKQIASEIRQMFDQLVNLANTSYTGQSMFAGHKYDQPAYQEGLGITTYNDDMLNALRNDGSTGPVPWEVHGKADSTIILRFENDGEIGVDTIDYTFSKDGGATWVTKTLLAGDNVLDLDGATVTIPLANPLPLGEAHDLAANVTVTAYDPNVPVRYTNGTMLLVRPAAYYQGDTNDPPPKIDMYGTSSVISANATGSFRTDVRIRLDESADVSTTGTLHYSYSMDNGITWISAVADMHGNGQVRLQVPNGFLDVTPAPATMLDAGQQFVIRPQRAALGLEISQGEFMSTTFCGKDIFGGLFIPEGQSIAIPAAGGAKNIFETVADFLAWAESGVQDGCQDALENLTVAMEGLLSNIAKLGGKMNRVSLNVDMLQYHTDDNTKRMSGLEDIDFTTLMIDLSKHQMAYQSVLQSSSMIMQLNLTKFI